MATQVIEIRQTSKAVEIRQAELAHILELRRQSKAIAAELAECEANALDLIKAGADIEPGTLSAEVKTTERRTVAWKAIVERELGTGYASNVLSHTKPLTCERLHIN